MFVSPFPSIKEWYVSFREGVIRDHGVLQPACNRLRVDSSTSFGKPSSAECMPLSPPRQWWDSVFRKPVFEGLSPNTTLKEGHQIKRHVKLRESLPTCWGYETSPLPTKRGRPKAAISWLKCRKERWIRGVHTEMRGLVETCQPKITKLSTRQCSYIDLSTPSNHQPLSWCHPFPFFFPGAWRLAQASHGLPTNHLWSLGSSVEPTSFASATHFGSPQLEPWNCKKRWEWIRNFHSWPIQRRVWGLKLQTPSLVQGYKISV